LSGLYKSTNRNGIRPANSGEGKDLKRFVFALLAIVVVSYVTTNPNIGRAAEGFALVDLSDRLVKQEDFRGTNLVLIFYVNYN